MEIAASWGAILHAGDSVPKWLIGSTLTNLAYAKAVWQFPSFQSWLPTDIQPSHGFVAIVGALIMGAEQRHVDSTLAIGCRSSFRDNDTDLDYVLNSYSEIYPFVVAVFVAALSVIFDGTLESKSPLVVGFIAALLPLTYLGFAPLGILLLLPIRCPIARIP